MFKNGHRDWDDSMTLADKWSVHIAKCCVYTTAVGAFTLLTGELKGSDFKDGGVFDPDAVHWADE